VIDLSQATVMPGFIDGHSHVFESAPEKDQSALDVGLIAAARAYDCVIAGFTTMRDAGSHGNGNGDVAIRNAIDRGDVIGPRLSVATEGIRFAPNQPRGPEVARAMVRAQIKDGATHIKTYPSGGYSFTPEGELQVTATLTLEELQAIVDEAHKNRLRVMVHTFGGQGLTDSIAAGVDTIEHAQGLTQELANMMVQKGIYYDPTIVRYTLASIETGDREKTGGKYSIVPIFEKNVRMAIATKGLKVVFGTGVDGAIPVWLAGSRVRGAGQVWNDSHPGSAGSDFAWCGEHGMGGPGRRDRKRQVCRSRVCVPRSADGHHRTAAGEVRDEGRARLPEPDERWNIEFQSTLERDMGEVI
jgi:hypothetical protein